MHQKEVRRIIDICMTAMLPMLMAYSLIGERFHEIAGTAMMVLFILHHILNRGWYKALLRGRYTPAHIFRTALDAALLVCMILQPVSGILMSKHLYTFIQAEGVSAAAREVHICLAYWGFVLMCIHAGIHLAAPFNRLKNHEQTLWKALMTILTVISAYGCRTFAKRQLAEYMFRRTGFAFFDYAEPRVFFFMDYIAIMALFAFAGYLLMACLDGKRNK